MGHSYYSNALGSNVISAPPGNLYVTFSYYSWPSKNNMGRWQMTNTVSPRYQRWFLKIWAKACLSVNSRIEISRKAEFWRILMRLVLPQMLVFVVFPQSLCHCFGIGISKSLKHKRKQQMLLTIERFVKWVRMDCKSLLTKEGIDI